MFIRVTIGFVLGCLLLFSLVDFKEIEREGKAAKAETIHNPTTAGQTFLDHTKPIFIVKDAWLCPNREEVNAAASGIPNRCARSPSDFRVFEMDTGGFLSSNEKIRTRLPNDEILEAWTLKEGLRN